MELVGIYVNDGKVCGYSRFCGFNENQFLIVYGMGTGKLFTYTTVLGGENQVPLVEGIYIRTGW